MTIRIGSELEFIIYVALLNFFLENSMGSQVWLKPFDTPHVTEPEQISGAGPGLEFHLGLLEMQNTATGNFRPGEKSTGKFLNIKPS